MSQLLGRFLEDSNPTLPIVVSASYDENRTNIEGIKNGVVATYSGLINDQLDVKEDEKENDKNSSNSTSNSLSNSSKSSKSSNLSNSSSNLSNFPDSYLDSYMQYPVGTPGVIHQDLEYLLPLAGDRNIYINSHTPSSLYAIMSPEIMNVDIDEYFTAYRELASGIHDEIYKPYLSKYLSTLPSLELRHNYETYVRSNKVSRDEWRHLFTDVGEINYIQGHYDRELVQALKNPERNLDLLRKKLTLDEDTGFYSADGIAYICEHEFMMYEGKSMKSILEKCANSKGCCSHCGGQLVLVIEDASISFTSIQHRLVFMFISLLELISYEDFIAHIIRSAIQKSINALEIDPLDDYTLKTEAFTAAYIFKLLALTLKAIKISNTTPLLTFIKNIWRKSGWDEETTKAVLDNGTYFLELDHCVAVIKSFKDAEQIKDDKSTIIHVLMDGMIGDGNLIQQIYMKDKKKFGAIVDALIIAANNYTQLQDLKLILGSSSEELKVEDVKLNASSHKLKQFFMLWWKSICPVGVIHEWKDGTNKTNGTSGSCKLCGINEKNVADIYKKYEQKLVEMFETIKTIPIKQRTDIRSTLIDEIKKNGTTKPSFIPDKALADVYVKKLRSVLEGLIGIGKIEELPVSKEVNIKMINYIMSARKVSVERLKFEIQSVITSSIPRLSSIITKI